jgi:hypothetical protein
MNNKILIALILSTTSGCSQDLYDYSAVCEPHIDHIVRNLDYLSDNNSLMKETIGKLREEVDELQHHVTFLLKRNAVLESTVLRLCEDMTTLEAR